TRYLHSSPTRRSSDLDREGLPNSLYRFPNPIPSRHFVSGSAIPLKAGELYIQNTCLFVHSVAVGITDNIAAGAGLEPFSVLIGRSEEHTSELQSRENL